MAKQSGLGMKLYLMGYDMSGDVGAINTMRSSMAVIDVTAIDGTTHERIPGLRDGEITFSVFFNSATGETHDYLATLPTTDVLCMVLTSTTAGQPVICLTAKQVNYDWTRNADGSMTIHFGGDPKSNNYLRIMPGWNYIVRLYRPRSEIVDGRWNFPEAVPAP